MVSVRRGEDPCIVHMPLMQLKLGIPANAMPNLLPMHQILAVGNDNTGEKLKCTVYKIIILPHAADAWIRIASRYDRILIFHISHIPSENIVLCLTYNVF